MTCGRHSAARCLTTRSHCGKNFIKALERRLRASGVKIRTRCRLLDIIVDGNGAVCGVRVQSDGRYPDEARSSTKHIRAGRAVILASGGYGADIALRKLQNPKLRIGAISFAERVFPSPAPAINDKGNGTIWMPAGPLSSDGQPWPGATWNPFLIY